MPPPSPVQKPRIPIWVVGLWPRPKSMQRVLRYDGILPAKQDAKGEFVEVLPKDVAEIRQYIVEHKPEGDAFDIVVEGQTPGKDPEAETASVRAYAAAGATWWIEANWDLTEKINEKGTQDAILDRIRLGPPQI